VGVIYAIVYIGFLLIISDEASGKMELCTRICKLVKGIVAVTLAFVVLLPFGLTIVLILKLSILVPPLVILVLCTAGRFSLLKDAAETLRAEGLDVSTRVIFMFALKQSSPFFAKSN